MQRVAARLLLAAALAACGGPPPEPALPVVAASVPPHAWLVARIAGPHMRVVTVLRSGESPHTYQPSDHEISVLARARLLFTTGVPFEHGAWLDVLTTDGGPRLADLREGIALRRMEDDHDHAGDDPHIWLAPPLLRTQAATVARALAEADPEHADAYAANRDALLREIDALHAVLTEALAPLRGRALFVYHPAWGYFCDAYGLRQTALEIEGKEPGDAELTRFQALVRGEGARVLFVQPQVAGGVPRAVARAVGVELRVIDPLEADVPANLRRVAEALVEALR